MFVDLYKWFIFIFIHTQAYPKLYIYQSMDKKVYFCYIKYFLSKSKRHNQNKLSGGFWLLSLFCFSISSKWTQNGFQVPLVLYAFVHFKSYSNFPGVEVITGVMSYHA